MNQFNPFSLSLVLLLCFSLQLNAQSIIEGKVNSYDGSPLGYASVVLYNAVDSSFASVEMSEDDGAYKFQNIDAGDYYLKVTYSGLPSYRGQNFQLTADEVKSLDLITLSESDNTLTEVTIRAKRPIVELKSDRTVFNVKGSINASGYNGLELLRKSPGVLVDNNNNISILGKPGVIVYIDDKRSPLTGEELTNYLRSLQASQIDAIEIITNPSSKYDAQGNAGIINIKLVKSENIGTNGSASVDFRQGKYTTTNTTLTVNHRTEKFNVYGTLSANAGVRFQEIAFFSKLPDIDTDSYLFGKNDGQSGNLRLGFDYYLSPKSTLGILTNNNFGNYEWNSTSTTDIFESNSNVLDRTLLATSHADNKPRNHHVNLNYNLKMDKDRKLNLDADYAMYVFDRETRNPNTYVNASNEVISTIEYFTEAPTDIDILTLKADYEQPLFEGQLSFGTKYSAIETDNDFKVFNVVNNENILDPNQTNHFIYDENVLAAYFNYSRTLNKAISIQLGLRMENTSSEGDLTALDADQNRNVKRDYTDWFPSLGVSYQMNDKNSFNFSYSRRLNRPNYQNLNPFLFRIDELTFDQGNAFLNPEYSHNFQLSHSFNYKLNTTFTYTKTDDLIARVLDRDVNNNDATYISYFNIDKQNHYSLSLSSPTSITNWWSSFVNLTGYIIKNESGFSENRRIDLTVEALNLYWQQTFTLNETTSFELSGWYNSPSVWEGNFNTDSHWALDIGAQKKLFDNKASLKITFSDIFKTAPWSGDTQLGTDFYQIGNGSWDSRQFRLSFNYNFGNQKVKSRKRKTGLESESARTQGGQ